MRALLLALLLPACEPGSWDLGEGVDPGSDAAWTEEVQAAVDAWDIELHPRCGTPAFIVGYGHPVRLVPRMDWEEGEDDIGVFDGDGIVIRGDSIVGKRAVLLHELGHALGLDHVSVYDDPDSVMHPKADGRILWPSARDVANVVRIHGCDGP